MILEGAENFEKAFEWLEEDDTYYLYHFREADGNGKKPTGPLIFLIGRLLGVLLSS
jgi:hypothetical protein